MHRYFVSNVLQSGLIRVNIKTCSANIKNKRNRENQRNHVEMKMLQCYGSAASICGRELRPICDSFCPSLDFIQQFEILKLHKWIFLVSPPKVKNTMKLLFSFSSTTFACSHQRGHQSGSCGLYLHVWFGPNFTPFLTQPLPFIRAWEWQSGYNCLCWDTLKLTLLSKFLNVEYNCVQEWYTEIQHSVWPVLDYITFKVVRSLWS